MIAASDLPLKEIKTAGSAKTALDLFAKTPFDIILSDIRMPDMDGLSMVEETRKIWPDTSVIFLTGYQDFEYARRAIQLGSVDYLLKPIMDEQLIGVLRGLVNRLDTEWFHRFHAGGDRWETDRAGLERLNRYFYDLLSGDASFCRQDSLNRAEIPLHADQKVRVLVIRYGGRTGEDAGDRTHLWLMNILRNVLYGMGWITGFRYGTDCSVFLLQPDGEREIDTASLLKAAEEMQSYFYEQLDMSMSVCLTEPCALADLKNTLEHVFSHREIAHADGTLFLCRPDESPDTREENGNYIVQRVERYIRENPGADLSLGALSSRFRINPSYLSRIFHRALGMQLSVFITEVRIEESKRLLRETDDRIYEISRKVGFESPGYFTKVFNRMVKMPPKEYRAG